MRGAHLAYYIMASDWTVPASEAFFVEAQTGEMLDRWSLICTMKDRAIYDFTGFSGPWSLPGNLVRSEGVDPSCCAEDVNRAYDYFGDVYDYYYRAFGRDGIDGKGLTMLATVYYYDPTGIIFKCPNAAWMGGLRQMIFCEGTVTDDIVGHELTHGVTQFTANLIYQNQPGQLNESMSDIFGELVDLFNGNAAFAGAPGGTPWPTEPLYVTGPGLDVPNNPRTGHSFPPDYDDGVRWLCGEDSYAFGGAIRDMWDPEHIWDPDNTGRYGDPAYANSPLQICHPFDNGGVHSGMAVGTHAFAMMTDGKTFRGYTVTGIGPIKAGAVWYRALTSYFTVATQFPEAYVALNQAAQDLIGTYPNDPRTGLPSNSMFTAFDAEQVDKALLAVEMNTEGACGYSPDVLEPDDPAQCSPRDVIYQDGFESGANGWTVANTASNTVYDWELVNNLPFDRVGTAWFVEDLDSSCSAPSEHARHSLISPVIALPSALEFPTVAFTHYIRCEYEWDGGNIKYRMEGGSWLRIPSEHITFNPYNSTIRWESNNPMKNEPVWTGFGGKWGTTVIDLAPILAAGGGNSIQFRFDFGKDQCFGLTGWYVDDFVFYQCTDSEDCNSNSIPDEVDMATGIEENVVVNYSSNQSIAFPSDADETGGFQLLSWAQRIDLQRETAITALRIWGAYQYSGSALGNNFTVIFHGNSSGIPTSSIVAGPFTKVIYTARGTGRSYYGCPEWEITLKPREPATGEPPSLGPGTYHVEIFNNTVDNEDNFYWISSDYVGNSRISIAFQAPGTAWTAGGYYGLYYNLSLQVIGGLISGDCNNNDIVDECEIDWGSSSDCNNDGVPDECQPTADCNLNGKPDICDIANGISDDCNLNDVPDFCETTDCNNNGICDVCETATGESDDCDMNGVPDECESAGDCNHNGRPDRCDVGSRFSEDCNANGKPDECEQDADGDGVLDECEDCPFDPNKTEPGACGCGSPDIDSDGDGALDCNDGCPSDPKKTSPGPCGCGKVETDSDDDTVPDCIDLCDGKDDTLDRDNDGTPDCADDCPDDPNEIVPGTCGCNVAEVDTDLDGILDCVDNCPDNANEEQEDADHDGRGDACDGCLDDPDKFAIGVCGCGTPDTDSDGDGTADCIDNCPNLANKDQEDADDDAVGDACDGCPNDPDKIDAGTCGCGVPDIDSDFDKVFNCNDDCPGTTPGAEVDEHGCGVTGPPGPLPLPDEDADGVPDGDDTCPETLQGTDVDTNGCPVVGPSPTPTPGTDDDEECGNGAACGSMGTGALLVLMMGMGRMKMERYRRRRQ